MRTLPLLLAVAAGCATSPAPRIRARTTLTLLDPQPALGRQIRLRLDLTNDESFPVHYSGRGGAFDVLGPDGAPVPYLLGPRQSISGVDAVQPGQTAAVGEFWMDSSFLIDRPGLYTVRFHGHGLWLGAEPPDFDTLFDHRFQGPSASLTVAVAPGEISDKTWLAKRLLELLPEPWELGMEWGTYENEEHRIALIRRRSGLKSDTLYLTLVIARGKPQGDLRPILKGDARTLWIASDKDIETAWPGHEAALVKALEPYFRK